MSRQLFNATVIALAVLFETSCALHAVPVRVEPAANPDPAAAKVSSAKEITAFSFLDVDALIKGTDISVTLPFGTAIKAVAPKITISDKATVSPASDEEQDFSGDAIIYTVTAEDGTKQEYKVTVVVNPLTCEDSIAGFSDSISSAECIGVIFYFDAIVADSCTDGNPNQFLQMVNQFINSPCVPSCDERAVFAYAFLSTGSNNMSAAQQINIMAASVSCYEQCSELTAYWLAHGNPPGQLQPCDDGNYK